MTTSMVGYPSDSWAAC